jgi:transketolase
LSEHLAIQNKLRKKILELHHGANAGHIGCSLSCIDILIATLIGKKTEKDTFLLSKGHAASALYSSLNHLGEISDEELKTYYKNGTALPAHPAALKFKGIPFATGSLGHGFPIGAGISLGSKLSGDGGYTYVVMSDGETNEGTTWEAAHFAVKHELNNLIIIIDNNGLQGFGEINEVIGNTSDIAKWQAIGFETTAVDGHNIEAIQNAIESFKESANNKPKVIIAQTVKGKGVSFMENKLEWHYHPMTEQLYQLAQNEITEKYS